MPSGLVQRIRRDLVLGSLVDVLTSPTGRWELSSPIQNNPVNKAGSQTVQI